MIDLPTMSRGSTSRPRRAVARGAEEGQRRTDQRVEAHRRARAVDARGDREVDLTTGHQVGHVPGVSGHDVHVHARVLRLEPAEGLHHVGDAGDRPDGDADRPAQQSVNLGDGVPGTFSVRECRSRRREERPARVGQLGTPPAPGEQVRAQLTFQCQQGRRQARLHHEHPRRGGGERSLLDDGQEVLELPQSQVAGTS
jgi:uncharacterized protein YndB with AHSA1/START domain